MLLTRICTILSLSFVWIGLIGLSISTVDFLFLIFSISVSFYFSYIFKTSYQKINFNFLVIPYFFWLTKEIIKSSISVSKIIWSRDLKFKPSISWVEFSHEGDRHNQAESHGNSGIVLYGNSITLTPGTITLDVKDGMLLVHALDESGIEDLKHGEMSSRVKRCMRSQ